MRARCQELGHASYQDQEGPGVTLFNVLDWLRPADPSFVPFWLHLPQILKNRANYCAVNTLETVPEKGVKPGVSLCNSPTD